MVAACPPALLCCADSSCMRQEVAIPLLRATLFTPPRVCPQEQSLNPGLSLLQGDFAVRQGSIPKNISRFPRFLPILPLLQGDFAPSDLLCPKNKCWVPLARVQSALEQASGAPEGCSEGHCFSSWAAGRGTTVWPGQQAAGTPCNRRHGWQGGPSATLQGFHAPPCPLPSLSSTHPAPTPALVPTPPRSPAWLPFRSCLAR